MKKTLLLFISAIFLLGFKQSEEQTTSLTSTNAPTKQLLPNPTHSYTAEGNDSASIEISLFGDNSFVFNMDIIGDESGLKWTGTWVEKNGKYRLIFGTDHPDLNTLFDNENGNEGSKVINPNTVDIDADKEAILVWGIYCTKTSSIIEPTVSTEPTVIIEPTTKYVNTERLNVRSGPSTEHKIIDQLTKGEKIIGYALQGDWIEIELSNGKRGFVMSQYLSDAQKTNSSSTKKEKSWMEYLVPIVILLFGAWEVFKRKGASPSSQNTREKREIQIEKPKPKLKLYMCTKCGDVVKQSSQPKNTTTCENQRFHHWTEIADYGDSNYHCTKCGITLSTETIPKNTTTCINRNFHHWTKL